MEPTQPGGGGGAAAGSLNAAAATGTARTPTTSTDGNLAGPTGPSLNGSKRVGNGETRGTERW
jgi:hypothetical protein